MIITLHSIILREYLPHTAAVYTDTKTSFDVKPIQLLLAISGCTINLVYLVIRYHILTINSETRNNVKNVIVVDSKLTEKQQNSIRSDQ